MALAKRTGTWVFKILHDTPESANWSETQWNASLYIHEKELKDINIPKAELTPLEKDKKKAEDALVTTQNNDAVWHMEVVEQHVIDQISVELNKTFTHIIENYSFGNLSDETCKEMYKDGRVFSHVIERWIAENYPLTYIKGCKKYDFIDKNNPKILYDEKTFTKYGCNFCPSNMLGQGRLFNKEIFVEKTNNLVFCIVSNTNFPEIKVRFIKGSELVIKYPEGKIPLADEIKFFD